MKGFDYTVPQELDQPPAAWRERINQVIADGGHRRVEHGETFAHDKRGALLFEVYGNIPGPKNWLG